MISLPDFTYLRIHLYTGATKEFKIIFQILQFLRVFTVLIFSYFSITQFLAVFYRVKGKIFLFSYIQKW